MSNCCSEGNRGAIMAPEEHQKLNPSSIDGIYWLQPYPVSLYLKLSSLNAQQYTPILRKTLQWTDTNPCESRLLLTSRTVESSPLFSLLTSSERASVNNQEKGLKLRAWDESGREYRMTFKFLRCNSAFRMIGQWSEFLRLNDGVVQTGDDLEIGAFRIPKGSDSEIGMALLHHKNERGRLSREMDRKNKCRAVKRSLKVKREKTEVSREEREQMDISEEELIVAEALVELKHCEECKSHQSKSMI